MASITSDVELRHIANAAMRIEGTCWEVGYEPPVICTLNELMEPEYADERE